jgi:hypothetical protein
MAMIGICVLCLAALLGAPVLVWLHELRRRRRLVRIRLVNSAVASVWNPFALMAIEAIELALPPLGAIVVGREDGDIYVVELTAPEATAEMVQEQFARYFQTEVIA